MVIRQMPPAVHVVLWVIRAGSRGEYEEEAMRECRIAIGFGVDLEDVSGMTDREEVKRAYSRANPGMLQGRINTCGGQVYRFVNDVRIGDAVVLPLKTREAVMMGTVKGCCMFEDAPEFRHWRPVEWAARWDGGPIPIGEFGPAMRKEFDRRLTLSKIGDGRVEAGMLRIAGITARP